MRMGARVFLVCMSSNTPAPSFRCPCQTYFLEKESVTLKLEKSSAQQLSQGTNSLSVADWVVTGLITVTNIVWKKVCNKLTAYEHHRVRPVWVLWELVGCCGNWLGVVEIGWVL